MNTNWVQILNGVKNSVGAATFAEDWAEDMVETGMDNVDKDVALVLDAESEVSLQLLESGEHANTDTAVEIARIPAFGALNKHGEQKLSTGAVGSFVKDDVWLQFVNEYLIEVKGLAVNGEDAKVSREQVKGLAVTWEDFKDWDMTAYGQAVDGFIESYLARVREHLVGKINDFS
ncbi:hypothetical protein ACTFR8_22815 [Bacillus cereus group sp. MYBK15-3]|uniref:hypothetical protein n=1 Tax=Bacillus cereus group TaxID=86661 RepID=UPI001C8BC9F1|nr:hypothetical protein [Bacillus cereus]MBX9158430.1 hypothetical protein [Bacillus cereus]